MTDTLPTRDDTTTATDHRRFPAIAQFAILVVLLGTLLGGAVLPVVLGRPGTSATLPQSISPAIAPVETNILGTFKPPPLVARAAFVYDVTTGTELLAHNADDALPLASITNLMTALVAREVLAPGAAIPVSADAATQASASGLAPGEVLSTEALRDLALLASANDAAFALAEMAGSELVDENADQAFIAAMNVTARELNLATMQFNNATGLDLSPTKAGAYGSARDVSLLMSYLLKNYPDLLFVTTKSADRVYNTTGAYHEAENTNHTIKQIPNLLGSKTGYTDLANGNLTIAFDAGYNRPVVITVLGSTYDDRFTDTLALVAAVRTAFSQAE